MTLPSSSPNTPSPEAGAPPPASEPDWARLDRAAAVFGITLTDPQREQLQGYLAALCLWNQRFNLTAIRDPNEMLIKHFADSLSCARVIDFRAQRTLIDVGTGAGFPGMVLKIVFPELEVTLLDAVQKRLNFLSTVVQEQNLKGVQVVHARAEDAARAGNRAALAPGVPHLRERFDVVTARAVAALPVLLEWTLPLARVGGQVLAMKGPDMEAELASARNALRLLGGGSPVLDTFELPETDLSRSLVVVPKVRATPAAYPRLPGTARKTPL